MALSLITPFVFSVLNFLICVAYPALNTFFYLYKDEYSKLKEKSIFNSIVSQPSHSSLYAHYLVYWVIYSITQLFESLLFTTLFIFIPLYYEIKLLSFFWLGSSHFKGAGYLYLTYFKAPFKSALLNGEKQLKTMVGTESYGQIKKALVSIAFVTNPSQ